MTVLRSLLERRNAENPAQPLTSSVLVDWLTAGMKTDSGVAVNPQTAMRQTAVYRCVALIAGAVAGLPLHTYKNHTRQRVTTQLLDNPHPDLTPYELWELVLVHLLLRGNAYLERIHNGLGQTVELWPLEPDKVSPQKTESTKANPSGKVFVVDGREWTKDKVFHIPGLGFDGVKGMSVIEAGRQGIGLGLAAEKFGALFFGQGTMLSGILTTDQPLNQEQADTIKERWKKKVSGLGHAHEIGVLDRGAKFQPVSITPDEAQYIETRRFQLNEIARIFGVPPHMIGDLERSTSWGTGIEHQGIGFVVYTLRPWIKRIEARVNKELVGPTKFAEFTVEGLLRGDSKTRAAFYASAIQNGWLNRNEVRDLENREPVDGLDDFLTPLNLDSPSQDEEPAQGADDGEEDD